MSRDYTKSQLEKILMDILIAKKLRENPNYTYEELDLILDRSWHN